MQRMPFRRLNTRVRLMSVAVLSCYAAVPAEAQNTLLSAAEMQKQQIAIQSVKADDLKQYIGSFKATDVANGVTVDNLTSRTMATAASFHVLSGQTFTINQGVSDVFMVKVTGIDSGSSKIFQQSVIEGRITSNGKGMFGLINPAGTIIKPGAVIDVGRFVAALGITDTDFLAGRLNFHSSDGSGKIVNQGTIETPSGGSVYLVGTEVSNEGSGIIKTPQGETILAAGEKVELIDTGTPGVKVRITGQPGNVTNLGKILADAGRIGMVGAMVRNSGMLNVASGIADLDGNIDPLKVVAEGGRVFLKASQDTYVDGKGRIVATGTRGGRVEVLGDRVAVTDEAEIDASGAYGGGTILVGGDFQGKNPDVQNATITYFSPNAKLKADATDNGDGGKVIVWADDITRAYGNISARGGAFGGNGGFVEVSGKRYLDFNAQVDRLAPKGKAGTLLLDPSDISIGTTDNYGGATFSGGIFSGADVIGGSYLSWSTIDAQLGLGNLEIRTTAGSNGSGNIYITSQGTYNRSSALTLLADNDIVFSPWTWIGNNGTGDINLVAGWNHTGWAVTTGTGNIVMDRGNVATNGAVTLTAGNNITITGDKSSSASSSFGRVIGGSVQINAGNNLTVSSLGSYGDAYIGIEATSSLSSLDITAGGTVRLQSSATSYGNEVHINSSGTMNINAAKLEVLGGAGGYGNRAIVSSVGNQTITLTAGGATALLVKAGGAGASDYANTARIEHTGSGNQSITLSGAGAVVEVRGGDGSGMMPGGYWSGECGSADVCSGNQASIQNESGSQSIAFSGAGGNLNLYGGSTGTRNSAQIENKGTGTQSITGSANILMYGGTSGGGTIVYGGKVETLDNGVDIDSRYGSQSINAASLYMYGGTAAYGGAFLSAPTQNLNIGSVTLVGGTGTAPGAYDEYGGVILTNPAIIGNDATNTINLTVGSLSMQGGTSSLWGGSWALIGGYRVPSTVTVNSTGAITLSGASQWSARIGSLGGYGGSVTLASTSADIALANAYVGTGGTGSVTIDGYGGVTQSATGRIETSSLDLSATQAGTDIALAGENRVDTVSATADGNITYIAVAPTHLSAVSSSSGSVSFAVSNIYGYGGTVGLGTVSAANGTVSISAAQQILDDNGAGTANISAQGITLISTNGTPNSNGIAISADVAMTGGARTISATVSNAATYGGISIRNGSSLEPLSVTMTDQSMTAKHAELTYLSSHAINMATSAYNLNSDRGGITLGTTGNLTLGNLATLFPGINDANYRYIKLSGQDVSTSTATSLVSAPDLYINANGTLNVAHNIGSARNIGLNAAGGLTVSNAAINASANVYLGGVNKYGGGAITLTNSSVTAGNTIFGYTGGDIRLNQGSYLSAGYDVDLGLGGTASTLYLNDTTGYSASYIVAGAGRATTVAFPSRTADGIVIDGASTTASAVYGSGIFVGGHGTPASEGNGLNAIYGVSASAAVNSAVNTVLATINTATTAAQTSVANSTAPQITNIPPPTTPTGGASGVTTLSGGTVGGGTGQFGGSETGGSTTTTGTTSSGSTATNGGTSGPTTSGTGDSSTGSAGTSSGEGPSGGTSASGEGAKTGDEKSADNGKKEDKKDDKKSAESGDKKDDKGSGKKTVGKCSA